MDGTVAGAFLSPSPHHPASGSAPGGSLRLPGDWVKNVCKSNGPDKEHHKMGQSESGMADLIEKFTYPGQTICDPLCGAGTVGVVALKMNRYFIGIDIDKQAIETTKMRLFEIDRYDEKPMLKSKRAI